MAEDVVFQKIDMKGKDIITIHDLSSKEVLHILKTTEFLKEKAKKGEVYQPLKGKTLGMIFHKASTRTRISFEVAIWQLGGYGLFLNKNDLQLNRGETIADTAKVLSRYLDAIMIRTYDHEDVLVLAEYADIPVINGLTDLTHPCQVLADLFTIYEKKGRLSGLKLAYIGDGNNMAHSLMYGCAKVGMNIAIASPKGYEPKKDIFISAKKDADITGSSILITNDIEEAAKDADVLYTDVWASMGQESEREKRVKAFQGYQINMALLKKAKENAIVMHCLPAHRGEEITDEVMDGPQSVVFDEAENRLHTQKAILTLIM